MIAKVIEIRERLAAKAKAYEDDTKQDRDDIILLENLLGEEINRLGGQAIKTKFGTAYRSIVTSFRVADRETWLEWVWEHNARHMLTTNLAKDAVQEHTKEHGLPPGLNTTTIAKTLVRSPSE